MGELIYLVNHTKKEYFCSGCKMSEIYINRKIMCGILYILKNRWNNNKIEILGCSKIDKISPQEYNELDINLGIDFDDF